jgi:hypothetical protein
MIVDPKYIAYWHKVRAEQRVLDTGLDIHGPD